MEYPKFKVCCICVTFNQSKYITDAMKGFTMQQTSFPFVCTIVDDASTDGEKEVIRKYVEENFDFSENSVAFHKETDYAYITYSQHKTNKNCYFAVLYLKENHYSQRKSKRPYWEEWRGMCEYEALCEGDDYWTDPHKLQKQVDFLDANPQCSLTYHACKNMFSTPCKVNSLSGENVKEYYNDVDFVSNYPFQTATIMYRKEIIDSELYKKATAIGCSFGDVILYLTASRFGTIEGVNEQMSVYRRHEGGISQHMYDADKLWKSYNDWLKVALLFGDEVGRLIKKERLSGFLVSAFSGKKYLLFIRLEVLSLVKSPVSFIESLKTIFKFHCNRLFKK